MKRSLFWNTIGTSAWSFISLLLLIIVTRINGIEASGIFSFAFAFALIIFTIVCYGGRTYQVSDYNNKFTLSSYISLRLFTAICALAITLIFILMNDYDSQKALLIIILVAHRIFDAIADVFYGILQKNNQLFVVGQSLFYKSLISFIAFLVIDTFTSSVLLSAIALPLTSLLFLIFYDVPSSKKIDTFNIAFKMHETRKLLIQTFLPFTIAIMGFIFANLARYYVDIYHPSSQGYFGIIIMPLSIVLLLFSFISTPVIIQLTQQYNNRQIKALKLTINKIAWLILVASVVICLMAYYLGPWALHLVFGVNFDNYAIDIMLVIIIGLAISLTTLYTNVTIIARKLKMTATICLLSNLVLALICIPLVSRYDIRGAIMAYLVASCMQTLITYTYYLYITRNYKSSMKS